MAENVDLKDRYNINADASENESNVLSEKFNNPVNTKIAENKTVSNLLRNSTEATIVIQNHLITASNTKAGELLGCNPDELKGRHLLDISPVYQSKDVKSEILYNDKFNDTENQGIDYFEWYFQRDDSSLIHVETNRIPLKIDDELCFVMILRDITPKDIKEIKLKENDEFYRSIVENSSDLLILTDTNGIVTFMSPQCEEILGHPPTKFLGKGFTDIIYREDNQKCRQKSEDLIKNHKSVKDFEYRIIDNEYSIRWISHSAKIVYLDEKPIGIQNTIKNITDRKFNEEIAKSFEDRYRLLTENAGAAIIYYNTDGYFQYLNIAAANNFGAKPEDVIGRSIYEFFPKRDADRFYHRFKQAFFVNQPMIYEDEVDLPVGKKYFISTITRISNNEGDALGVQVISQDITETKVQKRKIIEAEDRIRTILNSTSDWIWEVNKELVYTYSSDKCFDLLGYKPEEVIGKTPFDFMVEDEVEKIKQLVKEKQIKNENIIDLENWLYHKDGNKVCLLTNGYPFFDKENNLLGYRGADKDITDLKQSEIKIRESEQHLRESQEIANMGSWEWDLESNILIWSDYYYRLIGLEPKSIEPSTEYFFNILHPDDKELIEWGNHEIFRTRQPVTLEMRLRMPDNSYKWIENVIQPIFKGDKLIKLKGINLDISERKRMEIELSESESKYRLIAENSEDVIWTLDINGKFNYVSPSVYRLRGFTPEEVLAQSMEEVLTPESLKKVNDVFSETISKLQAGITDFETSMMELDQPRKDGTIVNTEVVVKVLFDRNNNFSGFLGVTRDITERKKIESKQKEDEEKLRAIFESANIGLCISDKKGNYLIYNKCWCDFLGYTQEEMSRLNNKVITYPGDLAMSEEYFNKALKGEIDSYNIEKRYIRKDNRIVWGDLSVSVLKNQDGSLANLIGVVSDITSRKEMENELRQSQELFRMIAENTSDGILMMDSVKGIVFASPSADTIMGWEVGETMKLTNDDIYNLIHPDERDTAFKSIYGAINSRKNYLIYQYRIKHKNGNYIWREDYAKFFYDDAGNYMKTIVVIRNITERKIAEETIIDSEKRYRTIVEGLNIGIAIQSDRKMMYLNPFLIKLMGANSTTEFMGKNILDFINPEDQQLVSDNFSDSYINYNSGIFNKNVIQVRIIKCDNEEIITELSSFVIKYYQKTAIMIMMNDVTERTKAKLSLIDALKRAEESDKLKSAFLQNISHEIRTPLNGIIGFTSILANEELEREEIQEIVPVIKKSSDRLIQMVNNILEISKIETGQIVVTRKEFPFSKLIDEVTNLYNMEITAKDIEFINKIPKEINELVINSDYSKLFQIFSNLVNNAAKFTNEGTIEIGIELKEHLLILFVKDTGVGISDDKKSKIFDRFVQADTSISRGYEGAGIGLAISKGLIHSLGGEIWFDSEYGKGSTFFISIPVSDIVNGSKVFDSPKNTGSISNIKNGKILIAEDDLASFLYLKKILKTAGFEILHAENGITAIDLVMENNDIILILMDMKMPLMDGFEATRQIKKINPDITVIAQTAYVFDEEKARILQSGCEDYIAKPINKNDLMRMLNKYLK